MSDKLDEILFCKGCGLELHDKVTLEWHVDLHGKNNIVPRNEIKVFENQQKLKKDTIEESKKVLDFAITKIKKTVINQNNTDEVFAVIELNNHVEAIDLSSQRAIDWLNYEFTKSLDSTKLHSKDFFKTVLHSIIAKARIEKTAKEKIHNRIAQIKDEIWYDLGRDDRKGVVITSKGVYGVILDSKSPIFRRNQSLQEQIAPKAYDENKNVFDDLVELFKIYAKDRLVFKVHLVSLFFEAYPMPIIAIGGPSGSFKTTMTGFIKRIVDPSGILKEDNVSSFPEKSDDMKIYLNNRYLASFDNVSHISKEQSDIFCRAITGNSNTKRKLYRDNEESVQSFMRKMVLNGIMPNLDYEDLQSRTIFYERETPDSKNRTTEDDLNEKFNELLPYVLGEIFHILSKSLSWYKSMKHDIKPQTRMSDFEVRGEIIARIIGAKDNEFLNAYYNKLNEASISSQDSYPLVTVLNHFMKEQEHYEGSAIELHKSLVNIANNLELDIHSNRVRFPRAPNKLKKSFKEIDSMLNANGLKVSSFHWTNNDPKYTKNATIFKMTKQHSQMKLVDLASPSSPSSPQEQSSREYSEHSEDNSVD